MLLLKHFLHFIRYELNLRSDDYLNRGLTGFHDTSYACRFNHLIIHCGNVFYFQPGHESHPTYRDPNVLRVIGNAVRWAAPEEILPPRITPMPEPLEPVSTVNPLSGIDPELIHGKR